MKKIRNYTLYMLIGACAYWLPDIAIQWSLYDTRIWIVLLTFLIPIIVTIIYSLLFRKETHAHRPLGLPLFMLLGIWLLGPLAIAIGVQPHGGTFLSSGNMIEFLKMAAYWPASTFMMSTYSGSLGGLLITTIILIVAASFNGVKQIMTSKKLKRDAA
jgi:hypothetical protein